MRWRERMLFSVALGMLETMASQEEANIICLLKPLELFPVPIKYTSHYFFNLSSSPSDDQSRCATGLN